MIMKSVLFACGKFMLLTHKCIIIIHNFLSSISVVLVAIVSVLSAEASVPDCVSLARSDRETIDNYYYPHESDCNLYYQCAEYGLVKMQCPEDLHFDRETNQCGWPDVVKCA